MEAETITVDDKPIDNNLKSQRHAYYLVSRMRWLTMALGPVPLIWDGVITPTIESMGMPNFITIEDMINQAIFGFLPLDRYADGFGFYWPHIMRVSTILFLIFFFWSKSAKNKVKKGREESIEARIEIEVERRVKLRMEELNQPGHDSDIEGPPQHY